MFDKLKAAMAFKRLFNHLQQPQNRIMKLKPGLTTSEFWTLIIGNAIIVILAGLKMFDGELAVLLTSAFTAVHIFVRNGFKLKLGMALRPGIATSEFWALITASSYDLILAALDKVDAQWAGLAAAALTAMYGLSRKSLKAMEINQATTGK